LLAAAMPGSDPTMGHRVVIALLCTAMIAASFVVRIVRERFDDLLLALALATIADTFYTASLNGLAPVYAIGALIVVFSLPLAFSSLRAVILYNLAAVIAALAVDSAPGGVPKLFFVAAVITTAGLGYVTMLGKLRIIAEQALDHERLQDTQAIASIGGWALDLVTRKVWLSDLAYRIYDIEPGTPVTPDELTVLYDPSAHKLMAEHIRVSNEFGDRWEYELPLRTAKGRQIWVRLQGISAREGGVVVRQHGAIQDITARKSLEAELKASEAAAVALVDAIPGLVSWVGDDMRYLGVNRHVADSFEKAPAEFVGQPVGFLHPEGKSPIRPVLEELFRSHHAQIQRELVVNVNGQPTAVLGTARKYNGGREAVMVSIDISEAKNQALVIAQQQAALVHASKMTTLGEMSGGIAHEINNPLTVLQGYTRLIMRMAKDGKVDLAELERAGDKILRTVERIARIVRGLRTFSREASRDPFETLTVGRIVADALDLCQEKLRVNGVELRVTGSQDIAIECRSVQIAQVLLNLIHNAFDATAILDDRWVAIEVQDLGEDVAVTVTDSGGGIPPDIAAKILQPFFTTKGVGQGTGLGLSISKGIIESHGGTLGYQLVDGHTQFAFRLPKRQRPGATRPHGWVA
jgi:signal transduction histidine kinase